ncbi:Wadjet anti-phage system protein JetD domain-containing protein [Kutzneria chonburiensis]|uniref:Wadjet anti-phage system protein JetD domain-containing protein n=1 Tax=Kutzneria chonburiensis TaxID=1483604 RepID=A0ABV6MP30_9PSEU|nr:Wadjet anti-phage system protein JetD domain-containing protein [Kutzneria chonburiensis]
MHDTKPAKGFFVDEAAGRREVMLPELPADLAAFTVPKPVPAGEPDYFDFDRVPRDRKGRVKVTKVDLLARAQHEFLAPPSSLPVRDLIWILRTESVRRWSGMTSRFGDQAWDTAIELVRAGVGVVRCSVDGFDYQPASFRLTEAWAEIAEDHLAELTGQADPDEARAKLLARMRPVVELADEHDLLTAVAEGSPLRVPAGSRTNTTAWSVYDAAIRAACRWIPDEAMGVRHTAKALAGHAFEDSKDWTSERETAFANLVGTAFDLAVDDADVEILMRGQLQWTIGSVVADAMAVQPWVGLPSAGLRLAGSVDTSGVRGVLLVENKDTFQQVCLRPEIVDRWLCVWGRGYASRALVALLDKLAAFPLAAWCDLDADGIGIITNLSARLETPIHPIGMDVDHWMAGPYRKQTASQLARGRTLARRLAAEGPVSLRSLAEHIAVTGEGREQETLYEEVLPSLGERLRALEQTC